MYAVTIYQTYCKEKRSDRTTAIPKNSFKAFGYNFKVLTALLFSQTCGFLNFPIPAGTQASRFGSQFIINFGELGNSRMQL
jgi:hypothetical protein